MKNKIKFLAILFVALTFQSCSTRNDEPTIKESSSKKPHYKVYVDGTLFSEATIKSSAIIDGNITTGNNTDFIIMIYNVPEIGETVDVDYKAWALATDNGDNSLPYVKISGTNVNGGNNDAIMFTGTLTRVSKFKVTFDGMYLEDYVTGASHDFKGEIEVEKVISM